MTGDAPEFVASALAPHGFELVDPAALMAARNAFVMRMAEEMSYWATWPALQGGTLRSLTPPGDARAAGRARPAPPAAAGGARARGGRPAAFQRRRHRAANARQPESLRDPQAGPRPDRVDPADPGERPGRARDRCRRRGSRDWTRRDLLGFLTQCGVGPRNSWSKERLAEVAVAECARRGDAADDGVGRGAARPRATPRARASCGTTCGGCGRPGGCGCGVRDGGGGARGGWRPT